MHTPCQALSAKPKIYLAITAMARWRGPFVCAGPTGRLGFGRTPYLAYANWVTVNRYQ